MATEEKTGQIKELHRECFLMMSALADIQARVEHIRRQILDLDDRLVEHLDEPN